ncbi:hypothetical protein BN7_251 [Wickerhamomyces ciferrii]|uniref:Uncharacterized protein n=1 Tax=Wickerhamomyces ciferrii (strain ATCC 14091 / BCRC 22168 / CBS 111 / JCM 3599 / NBRC 0793 / NRRL Y-1031 F-60-10) TaxID=1206466 RepID=K0KES3_WICCF|nr:uncharacterized protein BN7_251 [Wickerhamomyces ciferrii]CCH40717.1 hypothetical protein BN7_251 [Wickerhamomyces ciferrii]
MYIDSFDPKDRMTFSTRFMITKVRPISIIFWRMKVFFYHIRFWISSRVGWIGIIPRKINGSVLYKLKSKKASTIETTFPQDQTPSTNFGDIFPYEIWDRITDFQIADRCTLTRLNRAFYNEFSHKIYKDYSNIQILLVLSSTNKMKDNDACFLKYGPDFPHKWYDGYQIYLRNKESEKFEYEFLEVKTYRKYFEEATCALPKMIISPERVMFLLNTIMKRSGSLLKKQIKRMSIDISILTGYHDLFNCYDSPIKSQMDKVSQNPNLSILNIESPELYSLDVHDYFDGCRWENDGILTSWERFDVEAWKSSNMKFPGMVYFKELAHLSALFYSYRDSGRLKMFSVKDSGSFQDHNSMNNHSMYYEDIHDLTVFSFYDEIARFAAYQSYFIDIVKRQFKTKSETQNIITKVIDTVSCIREGDPDVSLFINGIEPVRSGIEHQNSKSTFGTLSTFKSQMTLLNRRRADN